MYRSDGRIIEPYLVEQVNEYMNDWWFETMDTSKPITIEESLRGGHISLLCVIGSGLPPYYNTVRINLYSYPADLSVLHIPHLVPQTAFTYSLYAKLLGVVGMKCGVLTVTQQILIYKYILPHFQWLTTYNFTSVSRGKFEIWISGSVSN